jgi:hypothetical protein
MGAPNDRSNEHTASQNPEGEFTQDSDNPNPDLHRSVSGDEAERAGRRATQSEPVGRDEIIDQSAYKDQQQDAGQQAAEAERARKDAENGGS